MKANTMTAQDRIDRIRAALERFKNAGDYTAEAYAALLELDGSTSTEALTAVLAHIDAQAQEIERLNADAARYQLLRNSTGPKSASGNDDNDYESFCIDHWTGSLGKTLSGEKADKAIDAAIAAMEQS